MKRKIKAVLSVIFTAVIFLGMYSCPEFVDAAEIYDYSGLWSLGNAKISVDTGIYCCAFSGTTGYGGVMYPSGSSFTVSCNYKIFAACAAGGRFYYFTQVSDEFTDCNIEVYDANSGSMDIFAVSNVNVSSNDLVAADSKGNIYFVNRDNPSLVKCFSMSGYPCAEISVGGSVTKLVTAGGGNVLAICTNGNYLINSSGGCSRAGSGDVYSSGNGYFSDSFGGVYNSSMSRVYAGSGICACSSQGIAVYESGSVALLDSTGKAYAKATCIDGVSRIFAMGETIITFNGAGVFDLYTVKDFNKIQEETTAPTTQVAAEEITRPTEPPADTSEPDEEPSSEDSTREESYVFTKVYTLDDTQKYIVGVLPSTSEKEFIGNFSIKNTEYVLQKGNSANKYVACGDVIRFISEDGTDSYRIVVSRDFNCDGKFNGDDIDAMAYMLLKGGEIQEYQCMSVDINDNGNLDLHDLYDSYLNS